jgi:hypothetical protein
VTLFVVLMISANSLVFGLNGCVSSNSSPNSTVADQQVEFTVDLLVGMQETTATALAQTAGWSVRVVRRDDEWLVVSQDYVSSRANLELDGGVVVAARAG